jgi:hypothetical protein
MIGPVLCRLGFSSIKRGKVVLIERSLDYDRLLGLLLTLLTDWLGAAFFFIG